MRFKMIIFGCFLLGGCNSTDAPLSVQQSAAMNVMVGCIKRMAATLDDGRSDPFSVAIAVDTACHTDKIHLYDAMTDWKPISYAVRFKENLDVMTLKLATEAVLLHRRTG